MRLFAIILTGLLLIAAGTNVYAQVTINGVLSAPAWEGSANKLPITNTLAVASRSGPDGQAMIGRTKYDVMPWETDPKGWYKVSGSAGTYTVVYTNPSFYIRPLILTNIHLANGDKLDLSPSPRFDYACFDESIKDEKPAVEYYQPFISTGTSVTQVGFKPVWDVQGGDGEGERDLVVSIHRRGDGPVDTWEQVGPSRVVPFKTLNNIPVEGLGARSFLWSVGWNSGDVPVRPNETYAVRIKTNSASASFAMYQHPNDDGKYMDCLRVGTDGSKEVQKRSLWMAVGTDNDGLVIPYNKCIHRESIDGTTFAKKCSQTYTAQGRSLASVMLYAAGTTEQPPIYRQKVAVRVREGGPDGPVVGAEKIAVGSGEWTGDSTWGVFALAYAPGEVPLEPGKTYAIEFESIENVFTLRGYQNIKNVPSGDVGGLSGSRKITGDEYPAGRAYVNGGTPADFDLDMQVVEYTSAAEDWEMAAEAENLLPNGDVQAGRLYGTKEQAVADKWEKFSVDPDTTHQCISDDEWPDNRMLRIVGGSFTGKTADGGWKQRVSGLDNRETYRLSGKLRSSWALDDSHQSFIGYDPTGQVDDPEASTIVWSALPPVNGVFVDYVSEPIRPKSDSISVWLRARTTSTDSGPNTLPGMNPFGFRTDFDDFALRKVFTGIPGKPGVVGASVIPAGVDVKRYAEVSKRVDELATKLPGRPVMSGKDMPTKLGLLYLMDDAESQGMLDLADSGRAPLIKTIPEAADRSYRVKKNKPNAIWIISGHIPMDADKQTPKQAADDSYKMVLEGWNKIHEKWRPMVDFVELTQCMWEPKDAKSALWYSEFLCELLPRIADLGPRPIVLNSGVGGLPIEAETLAGMTPGLRLAKHLGGAWGCHGYTCKYTMDSNIESYYSLRYRRAYDYFRNSAPDLVDFPMILLEGGVDLAGDPDKDGWLARGTLKQYTDWLSWYNKELMKDDQILGVTLFKIGAPSIWKSFELEPVVPWLDKHYQLSNLKWVTK